MKMQKKGVLRFTKKKRERLKVVYIKAIRRVQEEFGRKMNENMNRNKKLFLKELSKENGGKVENKG